MAGPDRRITNPPGGIATDPTGGSIIIIIGGISYSISYTNLVSLLTPLISNNTSNIATNAANILLLQNLTSKRVDLGSTGFSWSLPSQSVITGFVFYWRASIPQITITSEATTIVSTKTLSSTIGVIAVDANFASKKGSASTITVTITGGKADIITLYNTNLTIT